MSIKAKVGGSVLAVGVLAGGGAAYVKQTNRLPELIVAEANALPTALPAGQESLICAADRQPCTRDNALGVLAVRNQISVPLANISPIIQNVVIDSEDRRFKDNNGCDARAIARAAKVDLGRIAAQQVAAPDAAGLQGGSTITRQLVGLMYPKATTLALSSGQLSIKLAEVVSPPLAQQMYECSLALKLNTVMTKPQILNEYLNRAYFGHGAYGVEAAAESYYGIHAKDLNLAQSIRLVSKLPFPNATNPATVQKNYVAVISAMESIGHVTPAQAAELTTTPDKTIPYVSSTGNTTTNATAIGANYFVDDVKKQAVALLKIDVKDLPSGYKINTTLNTGDQAKLYKVLKADPRIPRLGLAAAAFSRRPDGSTAAMVGGLDYVKSQVNIAVGRSGGGSNRDAGSSYKPAVWATGYEHGMPVDAKGNFSVGSSVVIPKGNGDKNWTIDTGNGCDELGRTVPCTMTPDEALAASSNIVTGKILNAVGGIAPIAQKVVALGFDIQPPFYPSNIFGTGSASPRGLATGDSNLIQNHGSAVPTYEISSITDLSGATVFYQYDAPPSMPVFSPDVTKKVAAGMAAVYKIGTGKGTARADLLAAGAIAGKTGTGDESKDLWATTVFGRPDNQGQTVSIWVGNPNAEVAIKGLISRDVARLSANYAAAMTPVGTGVSVLN